MRRITASSKQLFSKPNNMNVSTQHMDVFIAYAGLRVKDREQTWMIVGGGREIEILSFDDDKQAGLICAACGKEEHMLNESWYMSSRHNLTCQMMR